MAFFPEVLDARKVPGRFFSPSGWLLRLTGLPSSTRQAENGVEKPPEIGDVANGVAGRGDDSAPDVGRPRPGVLLTCRPSVFTCFPGRARENARMCSGHPSMATRVGLPLGRAPGKLPKEPLMPSAQPNDPHGNQRYTPRPPGARGARGGTFVVARENVTAPQEVVRVLEDRTRRTGATTREGIRK
jgi:hypothetical protein